MINKIIEQLQEMGKTVINFKNVDSVISQLFKEGYVTVVESSDREYLVLVERRYSFEDLSSEIQESKTNKMLEIEGLYWNWYDVSGNIIGDMLPF
jgi:5'-3' exonuclease